MLARTWSALFGWGAGLMHLGVGAAIVSGGHDAGAAAVLSLLISLGAMEIAWGVVVLARERPWRPYRRPWLVYAGVGLAVAAMVLGGFAVGSGASSIAVAAGGLLVVIAAVAAVAGWRSARRLRARSRRRPGVEFAGLAVAAILVAGVVTPALSMTTAGLQAVPHGEFDAGHGH